VGLAASSQVAIMCAETEPAHCHRRLLSDKLMYMDARVVHILGKDDAMDHSFHPDLVIDGDRLVYRGRQLSLI